MAKRLFVAAFVVDETTYYGGNKGRVQKHDIAHYLASAIGEDGFSGVTVWASADSFAKDHANQPITKESLLPADG